MLRLDGFTHVLDGAALYGNESARSFNQLAYFKALASILLLAFARKLKDVTVEHIGRRRRLETLLIACVVVCRAGVSAVLIVAGVAKIRAGTSKFTQAILGYDMVSASAALCLAKVLPWLEITVGIALLIGVFTGTACVIAFILIAAFSTAVVFSLARGRKHHCGCVGFTALQVRQVQWRLAYRNLALLLALIAIFRTHGGAMSIDTVVFSAAEAFRPGVFVALCTTWAVCLVAVMAIQVRTRSRVRIHALDVSRHAGA